MAFLFRRPPPPPASLHPVPSPSPSDRLIQPFMSAYISRNNVEENSAATSVENSVASSDQALQRGTLATVANSIRRCVSGMSPWDISDLTLGLYKIATRHALEGVSDTIAGSVVSHKNELEEVLYWLDWAWASYLADEKAIIEFRKIREDQLKKHVKTSAILQPAYCIAVDDVKKCVVLSIRGTYAATDVLTDLQPHSEKFEGGFAHSGMLSAARWILENENDTLQILLSEYPGYKLVLTGHSLGAGAACLLSYLLRESVGSGDKEISLRLGVSSSMIECWGYGCPPCVDRKLCEDAFFIKNIVLQDDIVARASIAALEDLRSEILQTDWADVLEDGGVAKKMLTLVNSTNSALGNFEQALGYERGTFYQQAKSLSYAAMVQSFRASLARGQGGPSGPGYFVPPGQYGSSGYYGPPGQHGPSGYHGPAEFHGPPGNYGYHGPPGHHGPPGYCGPPTYHGPPGYYDSSGGAIGHGMQGHGPQTLAGWFSSAITSYFNTPGNTNQLQGSNEVAASSREFMEGGRLFVPGVLYHIKRNPIEASNSLGSLSREMDPAVEILESGSNAAVAAGRVPTRHSIIKGTDPKSRFMKIILSKSLLSDHSLVAYQDAIKDAIQWSEEV